MQIWVKLQRFAQILSLNVESFTIIAYIYVCIIHRIGLSFVNDSFKLLDYVAKDIAI